jgi:dihydrofolate synthase/folylpolyglutamate synthase
VLKIAKEKAGIIKENGILITATEDDEVFSLFKKISEEKKSRISRVGKDIKFKKIDSDLEGQKFNINGLNGNYNNLHISLLGDHQLLNASSAIGAIEALRSHNIVIPKNAIKQGLKEVRWPGRLEIIQKYPFVVLDCAKDILAMKRLKESIEQNFKYKKMILVISVSSDKKIHSMMSEILPISDFVVITAHKVMNRALNPEILAEEVKKYSKDYIIVEDVKNAVREALSLSMKKDLILVTGSLFTVAEARELWFKEANLKWGRELNESP